MARPSPAADLSRAGCGQLHNVRDPRQSLAGLNALKARGLCRYTGITTTFENSYPAAEAIIGREKPDFLEIDYAIDKFSTVVRRLREMTPAHS